MSEIKWIKLATNIFDNRKIRQIETLPDGDSIVVIWVKLLCLAGTINDYGLIYLTKEVPYTDQMLASQFNRPLPTVQLALQTFQQFGMIEIVDNVLMISNWEKYQNLEGMEKIREQTRKRVRNYRDKQKLLGNATCNVTVTQGNAIDIDKEEDKDIDKEEDIRNIYKRESIERKPTLEEVKNYIKENNLNVNAQYWYDYYESNGWLVGKNPMQDWKACVRRWNKTEKTNLKRYVEEEQEYKSDRKPLTPEQQEYLEKRRKHE